MYSDSIYEYALPIDTTISEIIVREGQFVNEGDLLYTVDETEYLINSNKFESDFSSALEYSDGVYKVVTLTAKQNGFVFNLTADVGLNLYEDGGTPLCTIAEDKMSVNIKDDGFRPGQKVTVIVNGEESSGTVKSSGDGTASVEISKSYYEEGTNAQVYTDDKSRLLGAGDLYYSRSSDLYYFEGYVTNVYINAGDKVERGDKICAVYIPSSDMWDVYTDILATTSGTINLNNINIGDSVEDIQSAYGSIGEITSDTASLNPYQIQCPVGEIYSINVSDGDEVEKGDKILTVKSPSRKIQQNYANIEDYYTEIRQLTNYNAYSAVTAQLSGIVNSINYTEGAKVTGGNAVVTVSTAEDYYMSIDTNISYLEYLTWGKEVSITLANNKNVKGYINHINYNIEDDTLSVKISVSDTEEISNGDILPGMTGTIQINY